MKMYRLHLTTILGNSLFSAVPSITDVNLLMFLYTSRKCLAKEIRLYEIFILNRKYVEGNSFHAANPSMHPSFDRDGMPLPDRVVDLNETNVQTTLLLPLEELLLNVFKDESVAYWCLSALIERYIEGGLMNHLMGKITATDIDSFLLSTFSTLR